MSLGARERLFSRVVRQLAFGAGLVVLGGALAGCDVPRPPSPQLWTLFDVQSLYADGADGTYGIADGAGLPGGVAIGSMLDPADPSVMTVQPGFAEGYPVGYVTTEVWSYFDEIWAQPMYVPVTGWSGGKAQEVSAHPIFTVGAGSRFYSPFWRMIYVEVPDGAATSARAILDGKYPLHPAGGWMAALTPPGVDLAAMPAVPSGGAVMGTGWLDGVEAPFVKFPAAPFGIGPDEVIEEVPIFHFVYVKDDGTWTALPIPPVLGTGPLYSQTPAPVDDLGVPTAKYSAYWRVYDVVVPSAARVFAPPGLALDTALTNAHLAVSAQGYGAQLLDPPTLRPSTTCSAAFSFNEAACLDTLPERDAVPPGPCRYLDSQHAYRTMIAQTAIGAHRRDGHLPVVSLNNRNGGPGPTTAGLLRRCLVATAVLSSFAARAEAADSGSPSEPDAENDSEGYTPPAAEARRPLYDHRLRRRRVRARRRATAPASRRGDTALPPPTTASTPSRRR